jgi:2-polyprenyl-6-methoxyphenol hydroxylase-like FAD-dependent oxidoreductase
MTAEGLTVGIVGGGIGGLNAALSLLAAGFDVHVYEQAPALGEVGAGPHYQIHRADLLAALAGAVPADALPPARRPPAAAARPADGLRLHRLVTRRRRLDLPARPRGRGPASGRGQTMSGVTR